MKDSHLLMSICPRHRDLFGIRWRCNRKFCSIPLEFAGHKSSTSKGQCGLKTSESKYVLEATQTLIPIGSRMYTYLTYVFWPVAGAPAVSVLGGDPGAILFHPR